jgi:hypothetical protein
MHNLATVTLNRTHFAPNTCCLLCLLRLSELAWYLVCALVWLATTGPTCRLLSLSSLEVILQGLYGVTCWPNV